MRILTSFAALALGIAGEQRAYGPVTDQTAVGIAETYSDFLSIDTFVVTFSDLVDLALWVF